ncbi:cobalt-precorrin-6A reductase [Lipingzhangella sp. LS1_29]|uniref:Cobalt-precorrin-6A reductase n=1 Tax=Lipingzhangella rawalii TaxID=2055835 RepID=A0ABU2H837_9ACTN|nr:cobalt-precorrin-6A reductase [Lipingzhangella rawalii]MDS1271014.1 cobalt-precorrin-6A reductase [Lipingzhangella rawalii]
MTASTVLILGGTGEGRRLADLLRVELPGAHVVSSLAGRIATPRHPAGSVRVGGFGGVGGLATWLREHRVCAVVDATHPFAARISAAAAEATAACGVPLLALRRRAWSPGSGDDWRCVDSMEEAAALVRTIASRVLLTVGRQELGAFAGDRHTWFLARCVDHPDPPLPARVEVLLDRGPYTVAAERALLDERGIDAVVTKNSGGPATAAKLTAARERALPVVMVRRPACPHDVPEVSDVDAAVAWVRHRLAVPADH